MNKRLITLLLSVGVGVGMLNSASAAEGFLSYYCGQQYDLCISSGENRVECGIQYKSCMVF